MSRLADPVGGAGWTIVRRQDDALRLVEHVLGPRSDATIVLTLLPGSNHPVLPEATVRSVVGPGPPIFLVANERALRRAFRRVDDTLALERGDVRVFWPGYRRGADPADHPLIPLVGVGEPFAQMVDEFASRFELSRPRVRAELKVASARLQLAGIQHAILERQLAQVEEALMETDKRLIEIESRCEQEAARAKRAEAELAAVARAGEWEAGPPDPSN